MEICSKLDTRGTLKHTQRKSFEVFSIMRLSAGCLEVSALNQNPYFCIYDFKSLLNAKMALKKKR